MKYFSKRLAFTSSRESSCSSLPAVIRPSLKRGNHSKTRTQLISASPYAICINYCVCSAVFLVFSSILKWRRDKYRVNSNANHTPPTQQDELQTRQHMLGHTGITATSLCSAVYNRYEFTVGNFRSDIRHVQLVELITVKQVYPDCFIHFHSFINGSTALCWVLASSSVFVIFFTRTVGHLTRGDQSISRSLHTHRTT
jgi:hypothetical protein